MYVVVCVAFACVLCFVYVSMKIKNKDIFQYLRAHLDQSFPMGLEGTKDDEMNVL